MKKRGFTIIELLIVMTVIAVLATIVLYGAGIAQKAARDTQREQIMKGIQTAEERYYTDHGIYTPSDTDANGAQNGFCGNLMDLYDEGYIDASPVDPGTQTAICPNIASANDGNPAIGGAKYTHMGGGTKWAPCDDPLVSRGYNPQGFTFELTKESGGLQYFCGVPK